MKIKIHRGQNQIGGSIIEVSSDIARVILDIGIELDENKEIKVPQIEGLFCGNPDFDAVIITHYHSDHIGLVDYLLPSVPVYMGNHAYKVMKAAYEYRDIEIKFNPSLLDDGNAIQIKDIKITPILCDHSAFGSYMLLIENNNEKTLYTGDFRANGRMDFNELLDRVPHVDSLIVEGTTLSREDVIENLEEEKLEEIAVEYLNKHNGCAFIMMSAMNIDRVITAKNIAKRTNRVFLEDIYTADITTSIGISTDDVRVFMTGGDKQYKMLQKYSDIKIGKNEISKKPFLMCIRSSMKNYLAKLNELVPFDDGVLFYGMWKGYLEKPETKDFIDFMESKGVKTHILHTSGHADSMTIDKLIMDVNPKRIYPVHTENAEWFNKYKDKSDICL
ncbi:MAG: MBL fold metallo-hydrolase [Oscillospiraceae bacterium]|nr:MBL fold metallo-hydrolase [Oscillospiraceae bacterium]